MQKRSPTGSVDAFTGWSLRPATEDDLVVLAEMDAKFQPAPWSAEQFSKELSKPFSHIWVLTDDETDEIRAGFIVFWLLMEECQIQSVAVDLPHRGLGLGQRLVRDAIKAAIKQGCQRAVLEVRKSNKPAIHLYQKLGFGIVSVRKNFYSNGEDAYQMSLSLKETDGPADF